MVWICDNASSKLFWRRLILVINKFRQLENHNFSIHLPFTTLKCSVYLDQGLLFKIV